jgi:hypothetical protein
MSSRVSERGVGGPHLWLNIDLTTPPQQEPGHAAGGAAAVAGGEGDGGAAAGDGAEAEQEEETEADKQQARADAAQQVAQGAHDVCSFPEGWVAHYPGAAEPYFKAKCRKCGYEASRGSVDKGHRQGQGRPRLANPGVNLGTGCIFCFVSGPTASVEVAPLTQLSVTTSTEAPHHKVKDAAR